MKESKDMTNDELRDELALVSRGSIDMYNLLPKKYKNIIIKSFLEKIKLHGGR